MRALADHTVAANHDFCWHTDATVNRDQTPLWIRTEGPTSTEGALFPPRSSIVAIHGFTQNIDCWGPFGDQLASAHHTTFVDAPGHGRSQSEHDGADLWEAARLVPNSAGSGIYLGYSMGGRIALHSALAHPEAVTGLVLIGATAGLRTAEECSVRLLADAQLAQTLSAGLNLFLERWLSSPLFAGLSEEQACRTARLRNRPEGLAASLVNCGTGSQDNLWDRLVEITIPVLLVSGSEDEKFTEVAADMVSRFGGPAEHIVIEGAGHCVHLEDPIATFMSVEAWISRNFNTQRDFG